jgi:hypothetical protein
MDICLVYQIKNTSEVILPNGLLKKKQGSYKETGARAIFVEAS